MQAELKISLTRIPGQLPARIAFCALLLALSISASAQPSVLNNILFEPQPQTGRVVSTILTAAEVRSPLLLLNDQNLYADTERDDTDVNDYLQSIADIELQDGPFAPDLLEQYLALGETHQASADHEAALEAFAKADYISRINNGLHSPEQFVIVENMIESHLARDEMREASDKQRYLLMLHEEQYGESSLELVPALTNVADWNFNVFNRQLDLPNTVISFNANPGFGFGFGGGGGGTGESPRAMAFGSLFQSQMSYWRAINIMLNNNRFADPQLHELEHKLIETSFLRSNREGLMRNPDFYLSQRTSYTGSRIRRSTRPSSPHYFTGRSAYERLMAYNLITPGVDVITIAQTLIALGDWNLLFDRQGTAIRTYERAHRFLVANETPQATIDALLSPVVPQQLPGFTPLPHSRARFGIAPDADVDWDGYVDVSFRVSRFGQAGRFDVIASNGPWTGEMESRLRRLIRSSPFRPRFIDGVPSRSEYVTLRYYFAHMN